MPRKFSGFFAQDSNLCYKIGYFYYINQAKGLELSSFKTHLISVFIRLTPRTDNEWQKIPLSSLLLKGLPLKGMFYAKIFAETRVAQISGKHINNEHLDFILTLPRADFQPHLHHEQH